MLRNKWLTKYTEQRIRSTGERIFVPGIKFLKKIEGVSGPNQDPCVCRILLTIDISKVPICQYTLDLMICVTLRGVHPGLCVTRVQRTHGEGHGTWHRPVHNSKSPVGRERSLCRLSPPSLHTTTRHPPGTPRSHNPPNRWEMSLEDGGTTGSLLSEVGSHLKVLGWVRVRFQTF